MDLFEEETQEQLRTKFLEQRKKSVGGSDVPIIMGLSPYKNIYTLWLEKTGLVQAEDISSKFHVMKGISNEPVARALLEEQMEMRFTPTRWVHPTKPHLACNDDGFNADYKALIEIKVMGLQNHENTKAGIVPEHYMAQVQYNLALSNALIGYFVSYRVETKELAIVTVQPDLEYQKKLIEAADNFWINHVVPMVPPELTDDCYVSCIDPEFELLSDKYKRLKADLKMVEEELEIVESGLHEFLGTHAAIRQNGILVQRITKKGNVNYKAIPELKDVDLEKYRAPSTTYIAIKGVKS